MGHEPPEAPVFAFVGNEKFIAIGQDSQEQSAALKPNNFFFSQIEHNHSQ